MRYVKKFHLVLVLIFLAVIVFGLEIYWNVLTSAFQTIKGIRNDKKDHLVGFYTIYEHTERMGQDAKPFICSGFEVLDGDPSIIQEYVSLILSGNSINHLSKDKNLVVNLDTFSIDTVTRAKLTASTKENPVDIKISPKKSVGAGVPPCYSFFQYSIQDWRYPTKQYWINFLKEKEILLPNQTVIDLEISPDNTRIVFSWEQKKPTMQQIHMSEVPVETGLSVYQLSSSRRSLDRTADKLTLSKLDRVWFSFSPKGTYLAVRGDSLGRRTASIDIFDVQNSFSKVFSVETSLVDVEPYSGFHSSDALSKSVWKNDAAFLLIHNGVLQEIDVHGNVLHTFDQDVVVSFAGERVQEYSPVYSPSNRFITYTKKIGSNVTGKLDEKSVTILYDSTTKRKIEIPNFYSGWMNISFSKEQETMLREYTAEFLGDTHHVFVGHYMIDPEAGYVGLRPLADGN